MVLPEFLTRAPDGFIHVSGHRIGLANLVHYYRQGYSAEMLACEYPTLPLARIHKVIAFYLENQSEIDDYIAQSEAAIVLLRATAEEGRRRAEKAERMAMAD